MGIDKYLYTTDSRLIVATISYKPLITEYPAAPAYDRCALSQWGLLMYGPSGVTRMRTRKRAIKNSRPDGNGVDPFIQTEVAESIA